VARVVALVPDLLFGSNVAGQLAAGGHEVELAGSLEQAVAKVPEADVVVVDLTGDLDPLAVADAVAGAQPGEPPPLLAFYAHVQPQVRDRAQNAGFALVVPRSRMAREGAALVDSLVQP
jgi:CheY-like chemotaxis protein